MADPPPPPDLPTSSPGTFLSLVNALVNLGRVASSIQQALAKSVVVLPLSSYATGVWTPALAFGGSSAGITYGTQLGSYTQVGREIICRFRIVLTSKGGAAGAATIGGLPLVANADVTNTGAGGHCNVYSNMAALTETPVIGVTPGGATASLLTFGAAASAALADTNFTNTSSLNGSFSYFV